MSLARISVTLVFCVLSAMLARADEIISDQSDAGRDYKRSTIIVPYAFSTEALDTGIGAVFYRKAVFQPQDGAFLTGYATANSSFGLFGGFLTLQLAEPTEHQLLLGGQRVGALRNVEHRDSGGVDIVLHRSFCDIETLVGLVHLLLEERLRPG